MNHCSEEFDINAPTHFVNFLFVNNFEVLSHKFYVQETCLLISVIVDL
jgi:hypothetical protein